jgi:hypothetical protein
MDSAESPGYAPIKVGKRWPYAFAVVFIIIIANYLLMNLLVCGVVVVYDKLKTDGSRNDSVSSHTHTHTIFGKTPICSTHHTSLSPTHFQLTALVEKKGKRKKIYMA